MTERSTDDNWLFLNYYYNYNEIDYRYVIPVDNYIPQLGSSHIMLTHFVVAMAHKQTSLVSAPR